MKRIVLKLILLFSVNIIFAQNIIDKNGLKQGKWQITYGSGTLKYEGTFKNDVEQEFFTFYYHTGELKATKEFSHNGAIAVTCVFYKNGNISASGIYVNKLKDSIWNYFNKDSILVLSEEYKIGELHGKSRTYYETGELYILKNWKEGKEDGTFFQYFINGEISIYATYRNGILNGKYLGYNPDGTILYSGNYVKGLRQGEWKYYSNGILDTIIHE